MQKIDLIPQHPQPPGPTHSQSTSFHFLFINICIKVFFFPHNLPFSSKTDHQPPIFSIFSFFLSSSSHHQEQREIKQQCRNQAIWKESHQHALHLLPQNSWLPPLLRLRNLLTFYFLLLSLNGFDEIVSKSFDHILVIFSCKITLKRSHKRLKFLSLILLPYIYKGKEKSLIFVEKLVSTKQKRNSLKKL